MQRSVSAILKVPKTESANDSNRPKAAIEAPQLIAGTVSLDLP